MACFNQKLLNACALASSCSSNLDEGGKCVLTMCYFLALLRAKVSHCYCYHHRTSSPAPSLLFLAQRSLRADLPNLVSHPSPYPSDFMTHLLLFLIPMSLFHLSLPLVSAFVMLSPKAQNCRVMLSRLPYALMFVSTYVYPLLSSKEWLTLRTNIHTHTQAPSRRLSDRTYRISVICVCCFWPSSISWAAKIQQRRG